MDSLNVHGRWEPVRQFEVQTLSSPASNPLTVADHDVEVRFFVAEVEKDLILIRRPWNLLYLDGDSRFGLKIIAQFLQGRSGLPLGPPNVTFSSAQAEFAHEKHSNSMALCTALFIDILP